MYVATTPSNGTQSSAFREEVIGREMVARISATRTSVGVDRVRPSWDASIRQILNEVWRSEKPDTVSGCECQSGLVHLQSGHSGASREKGE
jgi:hypothetical protein